MTLAIFFLVAAVLGLIFILAFATSRSLKVSADAPRLQIQPIDIEAFRNLLDPAETDYLRRRLPVSEFRTVQRQRLLAMEAYVLAAARNASILITIGTPDALSSDSHTAEAADRLVEQAMLLRHNAFFALMKIRAARVWPNSGLGVTPILSGYERLSGSAMLLGRLRNPAVPVRVSVTQ